MPLVGIQQPRGLLGLRQAGGLLHFLSRLSIKTDQRVFVGGTFFVGPHPYYDWPGYWPGYYYGAPVMAAPAAYWYYCAPLAAYYPYVPDCPGGWQLVEPYPY